MPPRTIDNYGLEASQRYADDQKIYDDSLVKDAGRIPSRTRIEVTQPTFPLELDALLGIQLREHTIALFSAPKDFFVQRRPLFTSQICPSLGSDEKTEATMEKLQHIHVAGEAEKERETLVNFCASLDHLNKMIIHANNERSRTQKG